MIAEYKGNKYKATINSSDIVLITRKSEKCLDGFVSKRDYFKKNVLIEDSELDSVYEILFLVEYKDEFENATEWIVNEGRAVGLIADVEKDELVIDVSHDSKDKSWIQYDKGAASKIISLSECYSFILEKRYVKKDGHLISDCKKLDRERVNAKVFKSTMIECRSNNL